MATNTPNYGFTKPELSDTPPDITATNGNWDTVDTKLKSLETAVSSNETIDEINEKIGKTTDTSTKSTLFGKLSDIGTKITNIGTILSRIYQATGTQTDPNKTGSLAQRLSYVISWIDQIWFELYDDDDSSTIAYGIKDIRNSTTQIINKLNAGLESENVDNIWEQVEPQSTVNRSGTLNQKVNYLENLVDSIREDTKQNNISSSEGTLYSVAKYIADAIGNATYGLSAIKTVCASISSWAQRTWAEIQTTTTSSSATDASLRANVNWLMNTVANINTNATKRLTLKRSSKASYSAISKEVVNVTGSGVFYYGYSDNKKSVTVTLDGVSYSLSNDNGAYTSYRFFGFTGNSTEPSLPLNGSNQTYSFIPLPFNKSLKITLYPSNTSSSDELTYVMYYALYE